MGVKINELSELDEIQDNSYTVVDNGLDTNKFKLTNLTSELHETVDNHISSNDIHITSYERASWNAKYDKPSGGISKTDLSSTVKASLNKADTSIQSLEDYYTKQETDSLIATGGLDITSSNNSLNIETSNTGVDLTVSGDYATVESVNQAIEEGHSYASSGDTATLNSAKNYADTKKSEAINSSTSTLNTRLNSKTISCLTLAQYNALTTKNANTLYFCTES